MMREIRFLREAQQDLDEARAWYENCQPHLGNRFADVIRAKLESIRKNPELYAIVDDDLRVASVRRFPYAIYFTAREKTIDVWAVFHHSRDPAIWQARREET
jgi:plasmid stabilization system protein ParE